MSDQPDISSIFVYGTLRKSDPSGKFSILGQTRALGQGRVRGFLYDLGEYPGAVESALEENWIVGELYELADFASQIANLDDYEGCSPGSVGPHEYVRKLVTVILDSGDRIPAWIYWYQAEIDPSKRIVSGDWLER